MQNMYPTAHSIKVLFARSSEGHHQFLLDNLHFYITPHQNVDSQFRYNYPGTFP